MKKLTIIIEASKDSFSAYAENAEGIYGHGSTVAEAKTSVEKSIGIIKTFDGASVPAILKGDYKIVYKFDVESLFNYYKPLLIMPGLEKYTGINEKQLHHYAKGLKKPRPAQLKKINEGLHNLAHELLAIEL